MASRAASRAAWVVAIVAVASCGGGGGSVSADRPVIDFQGIPFGDTCRVDEDCGGLADSCCTGGKCSPAGWCSPKCESDQNCPADFFCVDHDGKRCFAACVDDRDCPIDFICEDKDGHHTCRYKG